MLRSNLEVVLGRKVTTFPLYLQDRSNKHSPIIMVTMSRDQMVRVWDIGGQDRNKMLARKGRGEPLATPAWRVLVLGRDLHYLY